MVPVNEWPEDVAPVPDVNSPLHSTSHAPNHTHNKSATLQSVTSNIYEDLMDSSSDEGKQGTGSSNARPDIFSDYLDETFENEDLEKGLPFLHDFLTTENLSRSCLMICADFHLLHCVDFVQLGLIHRLLIIINAMLTTTNSSNFLIS